MVNYFEQHELECPCCAAYFFQAETLSKLNRARDMAGIPFVVKSPEGSACRCPAYNASVGGVENSAHTRGYAVDIRCTENVARALIVESLVKAGFKRIGIYPTFIHVDDDPDKPTSRLWLGP